MGYLKIKMDLSAITGLQTRLVSTAQKAEHAVAVQAERDTEDYVPARSKKMTNDTKVKDNLIIYPGPYAHYLWRGLVMVDPVTGRAWATHGTKKVYKEPEKELDIKTSVHPKAQKEWFEASKKQNLDKWKRVAAKAVERELKP